MEPYSNRELDHMFKDMHEKLDLILVQTTNHNGRMKRFEKWQAYLNGAFAVIVGLVVPILGWVLYQVVSFGNIDDKIRLGIREELSTYEINLK